MERCTGQILDGRSAGLDTGLLGTTAVVERDGTIHCSED
jgi:hypothetical protein